MRVLGQKCVARNGFPWSDGISLITGPVKLSDIPFRSCKIGMTAILDRTGSLLVCNRSCVAAAVGIDGRRLLRGGYGCLRMNGRSCRNDWVPMPIFVAYLITIFIC